MTVKGGTSQACAACKYQRRRCSSDCPMAPYFPGNKPKTFLNAHRLFGVSNITKILKKIETQELRDEAMRSIIYESEMRERFPVHGCCGIIRHLYAQFMKSVEELQYVRAQLAVHSRMSRIDESYSTHPERFGINNIYLGDVLRGLQHLDMKDTIDPFGGINDHHVVAENDVTTVYLEPNSETGNPHRVQYYPSYDSVAIPSQSFQQETEVRYHDMPFDTTLEDGSYRIKGRG